MSETLTMPAPDDAALPFSSLKELREAHSELLKRLRDNDLSTFLDEVETFIRQGCRIGEALYDYQDRSESQRLLDYWSTMMYGAGQEPPDATLAEFVPARAPTLSDDLCPYLGLDAFQEEDKKKFFGREELTSKMLDRLREGRLLVVIGPSGSGKSSLVRAGILPRLKVGALPGSENWRYFPKPMMPGSDPFANLARLLQSSGLETSDSIEIQAASFLQKPEHLLHQLDALSKKMQVASFLQQPEQQSLQPEALSEKPCVLVIDQFEELFTLCEDARVREAFINNLLNVIRSPESRHILILTMRIDYEAFAARYEEFYSYFAKAQERVTPLNATELRQVIVEPARRVGLEFEDGVINNLLQDILGEPAGMPLLQFTLLKLWEERHYNRITMEAYRRLGGGRLALARSADKLYEKMPVEDQAVTHSIMLRLVRPGIGLEVTSNRARRGSLFLENFAHDRVERVLDKLLAARLVRLTPGEKPEDDQIEVAHEALVRNWPKLVEWLDEDRMAIIKRRQLEAKAFDWVRLGKGQGGLLDAAQLSEAREWLKSPEAKRLGYDEILPIFVEASEKALNRQTWRLRALVVALSAMFLVAAGAAWWALSERNKALEKAEIERKLRFEVSEARKDTDKAEENANQARELAKEVITQTSQPQKTSQVPGVEVSAEKLGLRGSIRPLRPGASIGSLSTTAGTLCCIVEDDAGEKYLLSFRYVFGDELKASIVQPSEFDGGSEKDKVAVLVRMGKDKYRSGAIARLLPGIEYSNELPKIGKIKGIATSINRGDVVHLIGRGSGISQGKVMDANFTFAFGGDELTPAILTTRMSSPGDGGAPVFTDDGMLVGILWGSNGRNHSYVLPIQNVLNELGVHLAE
jgi:ABC-type taurine transport system ATPase subunit